MKRLVNILAALGMLVSLAATALPAHAADTNLITNPSVANTNPSGQPTNWSPSSWGTNDASLTYLTNSGHGDSSSLDISMSTHTSGDASWNPDASAVTAGQNYTYTDWYQSNVSTELDAQYTDTSGNVSYAYLTTLAPSANWGQADVTFTVPANVSEVSVQHILYSVGSLQTDDFSLTQTVSVPPTGDNLVANPSFETANGNDPANWTPSSWGTNNAQFSYSTNAHTGSKSATVSMTSYTSGDAKWYADPAVVTPGQNYTYTDWYQSTVGTQVVVAYIDSAGNYTYANLPDAAKSTAWTQYTSSFTVPAGTSQVTVYHLLNAVGSLTIDDVDLAATVVTPPTGNLVPNGSVETADPSNKNKPLDWQSNSWGTNTTTFSYLTSGAHTGSRAVKVQISKYTSGDSKWYFNPVAVTPDTQYKFSDYYKATVATEVDVAFTMSDGSTVYQIIGLPGTSSNNWANFTTTFTVPEGAQTMTVYHIIHNVGSLTIDDEDLQTYTPVGLSRPLVTLTFDDGYNNDYTKGLPLLQKYGFTSTQFIITGDIGKTGYMTRAQVKSFYEAGGEIASHTVTHDDMLTEPSSQWTTELSQSKTQLQNWIGAPVTDMAFPNGLYNKAIVTQTKKYYTGARGVEDGLNSKDNFNPYDIKVQNVFNTTTTAQIADWVKQAQATNTWLVLVYHSVNPSTNSGIYNVTPTQLDSQLAAVKASGVAVATMQQALKELTAQLQ